MSCKINDELIAKAQTLGSMADRANQLARETAQVTLDAMGYGWQENELLSVNCPLFCQSRDAVKTMMNGAFKLWLVACGVKTQAYIHVDEPGFVPSVEPDTSEQPADVPPGIPGAMSPTEYKGTSGEDAVE